MFGFVILFIMSSVVMAKGKKGDKNKMAKTAAGQVKTAAMNINNINALQNNVGFSDYNPNSNLEGTEFPKGSQKNAVFLGGFLWGGFIKGDPQVRIGGSAYRSGLEAGPLNADGTPTDPSDERWSIYRVRPDVYPGGPSIDLSGDAASGNYWNPANQLTADQVKLQYEHDWTNWPAHGNPNAPDLGAPFNDINNDGKYEPDIDIPGVPGADQTIFYVANDMDTAQTTFLYGTQPLDLELHVTMWAYAQTGALGNMYFKKWQLINKGKNTVDSMIVSYWTDVDLGFATDDLVGCDTTLSLQYCYNGQPTDQVYAPLPPPAVGFDFFQGPLLKGVAGQDLNKNGVDDAQDYAIFDGKVKGPGYINLPMTAAYYFINTSDPNYGDPNQGDPMGATAFYHFFNGQYGQSGSPFVDNNGNETKFAFPGDPVKRTGWLDGVAWPPEY